MRGQEQGVRIQEPEFGIGTCRSYRSSGVAEWIGGGPHKR
jgi:hypothetical protein